MAKGAQRVEQATTEIHTVIGKLRGEVETMMGHWGGDAATAFVQVHNSFEEQAGKINNALSNIHQALMSTHKTYGTQEGDQTQALNSLVNTINSGI
jgi:WXG100 family type VII secretion target